MNDQVIILKAIKKLRKKVAYEYRKNKSYVAISELMTNLGTLYALIDPDKIMRKLK